MTDDNTDASGNGMRKTVPLREGVRDNPAPDDPVFTQLNGKWSWEVTFGDTARSRGRYMYESLEEARGGYLFSRALCEEPQDQMRQLRSEIIERRRIFSFNILANAFQISPYSHWKFYGVDEKYAVLTRDLWLKVIAASSVNERPYVSDLFDCDDFALCLAADASRLGTNACGQVHDYGTMHAYNLLVIDNKGKLSFDVLEAQSDRWVDMSRAQNMYGGRDGMVIF